jgi:multisubunit Na+/H+ antiporter MnhF subunit
MSSDLSDGYALLGFSMDIGFVLIGLAFLLALFRLARGPGVVDRIVALDLMAGLSIGFTVLLALRYRESAYLNIALCLAFIAFIGTVALARYLERAHHHD